MSTEENIKQETVEVRSKTLIVLGSTFILPVILALVAVYIFA